MTTQPTWLAALEALVGVDQCETQAARRREYAIDGLVPGVIVRPDTADHVAAVLQWAQREKLAVLPCGSGTKIGLGGIAERLDIVLSTSRLTQISEYDVANFTLTAGAGMTFSQVAQLTATHGQMLPLQYPFSAATLGGLIAANAYSPKRRLYGGVRDLLLGLRIALPSGEVAHFGGKVVKNVAGYDMCKFFLGSLGALGVIVEATFKLYALPERDETLLAAFPALGQGAAAVAQLMGTQLLPAHILLLNPVAARTVAPQVATQVPTGAALLLVNCEGMDETVERQLADIARLCRGHGASAVQVLSGEVQLQLRQRLDVTTQDVAASTSPSPNQPSLLAGAGADRGKYFATSVKQHFPSPLMGEGSGGGETRATPSPYPDLPPPGGKGPLPPLVRGTGGGALRVRLGTLPSQVYTVMEAVARVLDPMAPGTMIIGDCGVGLVILCLGPDGLAAGAIDEPLLRALRDLSGLVAANGGYAIVESAPPEVKTQFGVWGPPPSSFALLKALKHRFDPEAILSPGRFIGGL